MCDKKIKKEKPLKRNATTPHSDGGVGHARLLWEYSSKALWESLEQDLPWTCSCSVYIWKAISYIVEVETPDATVGNNRWESLKLPFPYIQLQLTNFINVMFYKMLSFFPSNFSLAVEFYQFLEHVSHSRTHTWKC